MIVTGQKVTQLSNNVSPVRPFSCYTPALSPRLIKKITRASHGVQANIPKISAKCLSLFPSLPSLQFLSLTRVLRPSLQLNELGLIIKGISGVEFGCGVTVSCRHCGGV